MVKYILLIFFLLIAYSTTSYCHKSDSLETTEKPIIGIPIISGNYLIDNPYIYLMHGGYKGGISLSLPRINFFQKDKFF